MEDQGQIIGIDLGTTNSVVAVIEGAQPKILANAEGQMKTPSVIAFMEDGEIVVGEMARRQAATQPERTISSVKRLIGRRASEIAEDRTHFPYEMGEDPNGYVTVRVGDREYSPAEISAMVLRKLKEDAEDTLGGAVTRAVVTVPAYFDDLQRQATLEAAKLAGLEVLRLLNEPTAAAMAYGLGRDGQNTVAVYDFGGGTFDFSILDIDHNTFEVMATTGNSQLGGDDLDVVLMEWLADTFQQHSGVNLREDPLTLRRLKDAAEQAKCELSTTYETLVTLPFIAYKDGNPIHLEIPITRETFEELIESYIEESLDCCRGGLRTARLKPTDIDKVILVGGSTRIPLVQEMVEEFFGITPFKGLNPDEIVAAGAATQAGVMNGELDEVVLLDVTPHTVGLEVRGGRMSSVIEKNSTIPIKVQKTFTTTEDDQSFVNIHVLQGESEESRSCRSLGRFTLSGITQSKAGIPRIRVTFFINSDGILEISANDLQTGAEKSLTINHASLPPEERIEAARRTGKRRRRRRWAPGSGTGDTGGSAMPAAVEPAPRRSATSEKAAPRRRPGMGAAPGHREFQPAAEPSRSPATVPAEPEPALAVASADPVNFAEIREEPRRVRDNISMVLPAAAEPMIVVQTDPGSSTGEVKLAAPPSRIDLSSLQAAETNLKKPEEMRAGEKPLDATDDITPRGEPNIPVSPVPSDLRDLIDLIGAGRADQQANSRYHEAREPFTRFCKEHAQDLALQLLLARFCILTNQAEEARDVLENVRMRRPEISESLMDVYGELCRNYPHYLAARKDRAALSAALGDYRTAMIDLEFVVQREEQNDGLLERLRNVYELMLVDNVEATIQFKLVKLHLRQQQLDAAIGLLQQLVMQAEYRDRANKVLGLCFWQKGMRHLAWQKFRNLELNAEMKDILYRLAEDMERHDELQHSKQCLERIYESDIAYRDTAERLKKLNFRLELQKDDRYGNEVLGGPARGDSGMDSLGRFEVINEINRGSMGIVYKARDLILEEIVAIKVLNDFLCTDPQAVERFKQEARSARRLTHNNIVRIHDMFEHDRKKIISMEYIEGENLKELLRRNVTFSEDTILNYLMQICEGLAYAHRLNVVHRDIKPANIMLTDRNVLKITDFGIAKLLTDQRNKSTTMIMGTPLYMAPEQIEGENVNHRCDIYSLGVMLYEMVAGHPPFYEGNIEYQHLHNPPPEITRPVGKRLRQIIMHCLEKDPAGRFQTVEEILAKAI